MSACECEYSLGLVDLTVIYYLRSDEIVPCIACSEYLVSLDAQYFMRCFDDMFGSLSEKSALKYHVQLKLPCWPLVPWLAYL